MYTTPVNNIIMIKNLNTPAEAMLENISTEIENEIDRKYLIITPIEVNVYMNESTIEYILKQKMKNSKELLPSCGITLKTSRHNIRLNIKPCNALLFGEYDYSNF